MMRLGDEGRMDGDKVALAQKSVEIHLLGAKLVGDRRGFDHWIVKEYSHVEASRALRHSLTDTTKTDETERLSIYVFAQKHHDAPAFEFSGFQERLALRRATRDAHQERP